MTIQYNLLTEPEDSAITVMIDGEPYSATQANPHFKEIVGIVADNVQNGTEINEDALVALFDVTEAVKGKFQGLSDRVSVRHGNIYLDGDEVNSALTDQILDFVQAGEDFQPLVKFYEKLLTNPLGDVRESAYSWIQRQQQHGRITITAEGDLLGYKAVRSTAPGWREDQDVVLVPSRRGEGIVNGRDVASDEYIEQVVGDVVQMPRSKVLHAPSQACGDGLHVGTWQYASTFQRGWNDTVMLVKFNPRDIVSVPISDGKIRVCRYTVVDTVTEPLDVPVYQSDKGAEQAAQPGKVDLDLTIKGEASTLPSKRTRDQLRKDAAALGVAGRGSMTRAQLVEAVEAAERAPHDGNGVRIAKNKRVRDNAGDEGVVTAVFKNGKIRVKYDNKLYGSITWDADHVDQLQVI